jgi:hypothetical protein
MIPDVAHESKMLLRTKGMIFHCDAILLNFKTVDFDNKT